MRTISSIEKPFFFLQERVALRAMLGVSLRLFLTLRNSASVSWRQGCGFAKRRRCGSCGISNLSGVHEKWRVFRHVNFPHLTCGLNLGYIHLPLLLCFFFKTVGHRWSHFWPNPLLVSMLLEFWSICHLPMSEGTSAWSSVEDPESRGSAPSAQKEFFSFHQCSKNYR